MNKKNFSDIIVELRKEKRLTQQELAKKLNITDKAVSKWERGLSYPDITSRCRIILLNRLMQKRRKSISKPRKN